MLETINPLPLNVKLETALIAIKDVAARLSVSEATANRLKAAGRLPKHVVISNGCHRWRIADIDAWIALGCPDQKTFEARRKYA